MTPLGQGLLTGMMEVQDPSICNAMDKMLCAADRREVNQTVLDLSAMTVALCAALSEASNTPISEVLDCVFAR